MAFPPIGPQQQVVIDSQNFIRERPSRCPSAGWAGLIIENPVMRDLYRMHAPDVDLDADLLACAHTLDLRDRATVFYLKLIWRTLMQRLRNPRRAEGRQAPETFRRARVLVCLAPCAGVFAAPSLGGVDHRIYSSVGLGQVAPRSRRFVCAGRPAKSRVGRDWRSDLLPGYERRAAARRPRVEPCPAALFWPFRARGGVRSRRVGAAFQRLGGDRRAPRSSLRPPVGCVRAPVRPFGPALLDRELRERSALT